MINRSTLLALLVLGVLFAPHLANSQRLKVRDIRQDYTDKGVLQTYTIIFSLENNVTSSEFLLLLWPYELTGPGTDDYTNSLDSGVTKWGVYNSTTCTSSSELKFSMKQSTLDRHDNKFAYFLKLSDSDGNQAALTDGQLYFLTIAATPSTALTSGVYGPVELHTISSDSTENYITYDSNPLAGFFEITDEPPTLLTLESNVTEGDASVPGDVYTIEIQATPVILVDQSFRIRIDLDSALSFADDCTATHEIASQTDVVGHQKMVVFDVPLSDEDTLNITCTIQNAFHQIDSHSIVLNALPLYVGRIQRRGDTDTQAVTSIPEAKFELNALGAWGINLANSTGVPEVLVGLYKQCDGCLNVFNTFGVSLVLRDIELPSDLTLKVTLALGPDISVAPSAILHNFPNSAAGRVVCSLVDEQIECINVGALQVNTVYKISARIELLSGITTVSSDFGTITITDTNSNTVLEGQPTIDSAFGTIKTNPDFAFDGINNSEDNNYRANQFVHALPADDDGEIMSSNTDYGMSYSSDVEDYNLIFELTLSEDHINDGSGPEAGYGTEIITSDAIASSATEENPMTCEGVSSSVVFGENSVCSWTKFTESFGEFTSLRFAPSEGWGTQYPNGGNKVSFKFTKTKLERASSAFLANEGSYDFYLRGTNGITAANAGSTTFGTTVGEGLINAFAVNIGNGVLSAVGFGISLFWTGDSSSLTGEKFPAVVRVAGVLNNATNATQLRLFFTNLQPFMEDADAEDSEKVACVSSAGNSNCFLSEGENDDTLSPTMWNRIDLNLTSAETTASSFQFLIPVATIQDTSTLSFALALGETIAEEEVEANEEEGEESLSTNKNELVTTDFVYKPAEQFESVSPTDLQGSSLISAAMEIRRPSTIKYKVAQQATTYFKTKTVSDEEINVDNQVGAALMYCGTWKFNQSSAFQIAPAAESSDEPSQQCLTFSYLDPSETDHICAYCPVSISVSSKQSVNNFTMPSSAGVDMPLAYLVQGKNDGVIFRYGDDAETNQMAAAAITRANISSVPEKVVKGMKNTRLTLTFEAAFDFPKDAKIVLDSDRIELTLSEELMCDLNGHSCGSASQTASSITIPLAATKDFGPDNYTLILRGVDINTAARDQNKFFLQIYTDNDQLIGNTTEQFVLNATVGVDDASLSLNSEGYKYDFQEVANVLELSFSSTTGVYLSNSRIEFDFTDSGSNILGTDAPYCFVKNQAGEILHHFDSCSYDSTTSLITLTLKNDLITTESLTLVVGNGESYSSIPDVDVSLKRGADEELLSTPTSQSESDSLPEATALTTVNLSKEFLSPGANAIIVLTLQTNGLNITSNSALYVVFPAEHYSPTLGSYERFTCRIQPDGGDEEYVFCSQDDHYILSVQAFPSEIAAGESFTLKIFGVQQPPIANSTQKHISVLITDSLYEPQEAEYATISDLITSDSTSPYSALEVTNASISTYQTQTADATYNFTILNRATNMEVGDLVLFDFPAEYALVISSISELNTTGKFRPKGDSWVDMPDGAYFGAQVAFPLPVALGVDTEYEFEFEMSTLDVAQACSDKVKVSLATANRESIIATAASSTTNGPYPTFTSEETEYNLQWGADLNSTDVLTQPFEIQSGFYSKDIFLMPVEERFQAGVTLRLVQGSDPRISIRGNSASTGHGSAGIPVSIGCDPSLKSGVYVLKFEISGSGASNYRLIPPLQVSISNTPKVLPLNDFKISPSKSSQVFTLDFGALQPVEGFQLEFTSQDSDRAEVRNANSNSQVVTFSQSSPVADVKVIVKGLNGVDESVDIDVEISGNEASSLSLPSSTIRVLFVQSYANSPKAKAVKVVSQHESAVVGFRSDQISDIYYALARKNMVILTCEQIMAEAGGFFESTHDQSDLRMGIIPVVEENRLYGRHFDGLVGNKDYVVLVCAKNANGRVGDLDTFEFKNGDNGAQITNAAILFSAPLSVQAQIELACFFSNYFQTRPEHVVTYQGLQCGSSQQRILEGKKNFIIIIILRIKT